MKDRGITLRQLRRYTAQTQVEAAAAAAMTQGELSKLERRNDYLLSTVRRYVAALGGEVDVVIRLGSSSFRLLDELSAPQELTMEDLDDALTGLAGLGDWLRPLVRAVPAAQHGVRHPDHGEFSLVEHVWHLRDLELEAFAERVRRILAEDHPSLPDFDGARAATERGYARRPVATALDELLAARRRNLARLRKLDAAALARDGELEGVGRITLGELIVRWRAHDTGHRLEMTGLAEALAR